MKLGPILAFLSGLFTITLATLGLLAAKGILNHMDFLGDYEKAINKTTSEYNTSAAIVYGVVAGIGAIQLLLGFFSFRKPKGIASFILLAIYALGAGLAVYTGYEANYWPTSTIVLIVVNGVAASGLLFGFFGE